MDEYRRSLRQRVLKSGKIVYGGGTIVVDCVIRNLSANGARLEVPTSIPVPDKFDLVETAGNRRRPATVVWRKGALMGVRFDGERQE